jgi:hypothetical protein
MPPRKIVADDSDPGEVISPKILDACLEFFKATDMEPIPDAVEQMALVFYKALRVMVERGYDPKGGTWKSSGWRGLLLEIRKKLTRLWHRSWLHSAFDPDSALDLVNYAGMYYRFRCQGDPWGELGEPGSLDDVPMSPISMGDYKTVTKE